MLKEEQYQISGSGAPETKRMLIRLRDYIRFTVHVIRKLHPEYAIDFNNNGWQSLMQSTKVRDRLMHPKCKADPTRVACRAGKPG